MQQQEQNPTIVKPTKEGIFSFEVIEEFVDRLFEESGEKQNAEITFIDGVITLTVCEFKECSIEVFRTKETNELYNRMDAYYLGLVDGSSTGDDFWDNWNAIKEGFQDYKIVDTVLNP